MTKTLSGRMTKTPSNDKPARAAALSFHINREHTTPRAGLADRTPTSAAFTPTAAARLLSTVTAPRDHAEDEITGVSSQSTEGYQGSLSLAALREDKAETAEAAAMDSKTEAVEAAYPRLLGRRPTVAPEAAMTQRHTMPDSSKDAAEVARAAFLARQQRIMSRRLPVFP
jgi:hypothetical protein